MTKIKTNEIPGRAKDLFIKLYCEKKGGETKVNLHNAAQSWLSLSHKKKQDFYDTVSIKSVIKNAQLIIQTEPFLKSKLPSIARKNCQIPTESEKPLNEDNSELSSTENMHCESTMECESHSNSFSQEQNEYDIQPATSAQDDSSVQGVEESESQPESINTQKCDEITQQKSFMNVIDPDEDTYPENELNNANTENEPLQEPVLPVIKAGRDLFNLLKTRNGTTATYESLTLVEKRFYGRAALGVKRQYVQNYRAFLESMTSRQLFDYYRKVFF